MMNNRVILRNEKLRKLACGMIKSAAPDSVVQIYSPKRTIPQNDLLWSILTEVSQAKPLGKEHTPDIWKLLFMSAAGHECQFLEGLDGIPFPAGLKSSKLTTKQMGDLIDWIYSWGNRNGVKFTSNH